MLVSRALSIYLFGINRIFEESERFILNIDIGFLYRIPAANDLKCCGRTSDVTQG